MFELEKLVRENVKRHSPYSCARDDYKGREGIFLDANENPYGDLNRYPDPYQKELKAEICRIKKVKEDELFLGNGSDEIIDLVFRIFCIPGRDKIMVFPPTYGMYGVSASVNDTGIISIPLKEDFQVNVEEAEKHFSDPGLKIIFFCSPNNPTGNSMNIKDMEYIIRNFRGIILVDEAYSDFSDKPSLLEKAGKYPNLVVMQTFSKALGLASVRIGMAFSDPQVIQYFNRIKPPYNISTINQATALKRLMEKDITIQQVATIKRERERLRLELGNLRAVRFIYPSDSNFLLVKVSDANQIYEYLTGRGIIVRNRSTVAENCIRITVGTEAENNRLIEELKKAG